MKQEYKLPRSMKPTMTRREAAIQLARIARNVEAMQRYQAMTDEQYADYEADAEERHAKIKRSAGRWS